MPAEDPPLVTAPEADRYLNVRPGTVRGWASRYGLTVRGHVTWRGRPIPLYDLADINRIERSTREAEHPGKRRPLVA